MPRSREPGRRLGPWLVVVAALASGPAAGCAGEPPAPEAPRNQVTEETTQRVADTLAHLNNESETERWRESLVEEGMRSPDHKAYVLGRLREKLEESYQHGGQGPGVLRASGRRRAVQVVARLGPSPEGQALLRRGLDDILEVRAVAAAGLAEWDDASVIPALLAVVLEAREGDEARQTALQALRRLATAERRATFLSALNADNRVVMRPVVLASFPADAAQRAPALREVAGTHANPHARAFALEVLVDERDASALELARRALDSGDPALRPVALTALGQAGGARAAEEIERVLLADPPDAVDVVRGLYRVGRLEALERAINVLSQRDLRPATRAAVAREFLCRLGAADAPELYRGGQARALALQGLRAALESEREGPVAAAVVEALGLLGERGPDVALLLVLLRTPSPEVTPAVVRALGRLGGDYAAAKLVELIGDDPSLRDVAAEALGGFAEPREVPVDSVIDLLEHQDVSARRAALAALMRLSGSNDPLGYDAQADETARFHGVRRWRDWWAARRGR